jgi:hypothetical protein
MHQPGQQGKWDWADVGYEIPAEILQIVTTLLGQSVFAIAFGMLLLLSSAVYQLVEVPARIGILRLIAPAPAPV